MLKSFKADVKEIKNIKNLEKGCKLNKDLLIAVSDYLVDYISNFLRKE